MKWQPQAPAPQTESSPYSDAASSDGLPPPAISNGRRKGYLHGDLSLGAHAALTAAFLFVFDSIPRLFYLHLLLRIPSLYFSRVTRIFEDARLSLPDIKRMARARAEQWNPSENHAVPSMFLVHPDQQALPHSLLIFRSSWENFIDSLMREWKTLNVISVLLMSAILTMLQIDAAAAHPVTRTTALFSLICALMSLLYGCMYIIRFGTMRKMHKASSFANEAQKGTTSIWWNVWVLLAMPAVWLAWSIILFLACIMSFIWSSGSSQDTPAFDISPGATLGLRIGLTVVFSLGLIYFALIVRTFHRYGDPLDREWMRTVNEWTNQTSYMPYPSQPLPPTFDRKVSVPPSRSSTRHSDSAVIGRSVSPTSALHPVQIEIPVSVLAMNDLTRLQPAVPLTTRPSAFFKPLGGRTRSLLKSEPVTIMQLGPDVKAQPMGYANPMWANAIQPDDWSRFMLVRFSAF
ncbi:hypothetical protein B0H17DRAFT_916919 [Mycena rosella]|uniref:Uncharacterized protein n=1 Tax=Mycena rosella TaxID=1033263 RepID=A0AAD7GZT5_MYCRO|nr:hypothetical protein B0H17DRAFT_916919 [Mycena rosella]